MDSLSLLHLSIRITVIRLRTPELSFSSSKAKTLVVVFIDAASGIQDILHQHHGEDVVCDLKLHLFLGKHDDEAFERNDRPKAANRF
jgi:hypothetical protein